MKAREIRFGRNLKALRQMKNVTQQQLANELHISRQALSMWEKEKGKPDIFYLDYVCNYFEVSLDQMMYGDIVSSEQYKTLDISELKDGRTGEEELVTFLEEDIAEKFPPICIDFGIIIAIALELKQMEYEITEVFGNGFSVFTKTKAARKRIKEDIYQIGESLVHRDNDRAVKKREEVEEKVWEVENEIIEETMTEILGKDPSEFAYVWYDEEENLGGYADTEEECMKQARRRKCNRYRIMNNI